MTWLTLKRERYVPNSLSYSPDLLIWKIVLILDNTGAAGRAAVQISQIAKARYFIVTENEDTYAGLIQYGFTDDEIILWKDGGISNEIQRRTEGVGADIIFSYRMVDSNLLQECVLNLAPFARLILFGQRNSQLSALDGLSYPSELSVSFFDISDLCQRKPKIAARYTVSPPLQTRFLANEYLDCFTKVSNYMRMEKYQM
jgi:NADPH:quinone reductase-like Zn-dependent oxidoreductase